MSRPSGVASLYPMDDNICDKNFTHPGRTLVSGGQISDALLWETTPLDNIKYSVDPKNKVTVLWGNLKQR